MKYCMIALLCVILSGCVSTGSHAGYIPIKSSYSSWDLYEMKTIGAAEAVMRQANSPY